MVSVSTPDEQPRQALLVRWLNELPDYVILRNEKDLFESLARGGDVDLLVGDLGLAERTLIHHVGPPLRITRRSSVTGYSYEWGHIDLLSRLEWRGACYLQTQTVLKTRQLSASGRPVPALAHEALISWLTSLLWGGFFKERYDSLICDAARVDHSQVCGALIEAFGKRWGGQMCRAATEGRPEASAAWARSLRFALWWRACARSPVRTIRNFLAFVTSELRLRARPPLPWIAVVGTDPQETASVTRTVVERFATCRYAAARAFQWPRTTSRPPIASAWQSLAMAASWVVAYWTHWVHLRAKGYVVVIECAQLWPGLVPRPDLVFVVSSGSDLRSGHSPEKTERAAGVMFGGSSQTAGPSGEIEDFVRSWLAGRAGTGPAFSSTGTKPTGTMECSRGPAFDQR